MSEFIFAFFESISWPTALLVGFFLLFLNGTILTPSSELTLAVLGLYASTQEWLFFPALATGIVGNMTGFIVLFLICRKYSDFINDLIMNSKWHYVKHMIQKAKTGFHAYGHHYILFGRYIPNVRSAITIPAGLSNMPLGRFILYTGIGCATWSAVWVAIGFFLGPALLSIIETHKAFAAGLLMAIILAVVAHRHFFFKKRNLDSAC
ncbi:DedA family protein [Balneolaceae bacterium ANBcel3]|nr:DedA family protein [Balneolaceae bacterium ANBcel3]